MEGGDKMAPSDVWGQSEEFVLSWEAAEGEGEALTACENLDLDPNAL